MIGVFITFWRQQKSKNQTVYCHDSVKASLIGRQNDLKLLNQAWDDDAKNLFVLTALGGTGKTSLLQAWLSDMEKRDWRGADRVLGWSFPDVSEETDMQTLAYEFIEHALRWFSNDRFPKNPLEQLALLGKLIQRHRTLLVLDNFPNLNYRLEGDQQPQNTQALVTLLNCLAAYNPGLCVIATREPLAACDVLQPAILQYVLGDLSVQEGADLLAQQGVQALPEVLQKLAYSFCGHALSLSLLGSYLAHAHHGKVRGLESILLWRDSEREGLQTRRIMAVFEHWLWKTPELLLLYLISLLDRPVTQQELFILLNSQRQPWLKRWLKAEETLDALVPLSRLIIREFSKVQRRLYHMHLLTASPMTGALDTHPLIRTHFRERVKVRFPEIPAKLQGLLEHCVQKISVVLPPSSTAFTDKCYVALPDLPSAVQSTRSLGVKLEQSALKKHWYRAAIIAHHLCEHHLILGNISAAVYCARRSVAYAELSHDRSSLLQNLKLLTSLLTFTGSSREASMLMQRARTNHSVKKRPLRLPA